MTDKLFNEILEKCEYFKPTQVMRSFNLSQAQTEAILEEMLELDLITFSYLNGTRVILRKEQKNQVIS